MVLRIPIIDVGIQTKVIQVPIMAVGIKKWLYEYRLWLLHTYCIKVVVIQALGKVLHTY